MSPRSRPDSGRKTTPVGGRGSALFWYFALARFLASLPLAPTNVEGSRAVARGSGDSANLVPAQVDALHHRVSRTPRPTSPRRSASWATSACLGGRRPWSPSERSRQPTRSQPRRRCGRTSADGARRSPRRGAGPTRPRCATTTVSEPAHRNVAKRRRKSESSCGGHGLRGSAHVSARAPRNARGTLRARH